MIARDGDPGFVVGNNMKVTKISERYEITEGEYSIYVTQDNERWEITGPFNNEEFVFNNINSPETRAKWSAVASMIKRATKLMEGEL